MTSMISVRSKKKISVALTHGAYIFVSGIASARVFSGYRLILYAISPSRLIDSSAGKTRSLFLFPLPYLISVLSVSILLKDPKSPRSF